MLRRVLLLVAGALVAGDLCALGVISNGPVSPGVSLATTNNETSLKDLEVPATNVESVVALTTTTTAPATTTSTIAAAVTTTQPPVVTTTTTLPPNSVIIEWIVNRYPYAVEMAIGSDESIARWVLEPGQTGPAAVIHLGEHDSSGSHVVSVPSCGHGDQGGYFTAGHHYTIEIVENGMPQGCDGVPGFWPIMHDLTDGTQQHIT